MLTVLAPTQSTPLPGTTLFLLHRWNTYRDYRTHHTTPETAHAELAKFVRANWDDVRIRRRGPESPDGLRDSEAIDIYYDGTDDADDEVPADLSSATVASGTVAFSEDGFEILEVPLFGPEPDTVTLRHGTLRRIEDQPGTADPATYCLDAVGLTVAVTAGPDGSPHVTITPQPHLAGVPITLRVEDTAEAEVLEQICLAS